MQSEFQALKAGWLTQSKKSCMARSNLYKLMFNFCCPSQRQRLVREDSQIDFTTVNVFLHVGGGGGRGFTQERFSNFSNNRFFQAEKLPEKFKKLVSKEEYYR